MYTNSFTVYIKTDYIYKEMAEGVEARLDTSNYDWTLSKTKHTKVIGLMKDELGRKIMTKGESGTKSVP